MIISRSGSTDGAANFIGTRADCIGRRLWITLRNEQINLPLSCTTYGTGRGLKESRKGQATGAERHRRLRLLLSQHLSPEGCHELDAARSPSETSQRKLGKQTKYTHASAHGLVE